MSVLQIWQQGSFNQGTTLRLIWGAKKGVLFLSSLQKDQEIKSLKKGLWMHCCYYTKAAYLKPTFLDFFSVSLQLGFCPIWADIVVLRQLFLIPFSISVSYCKKKLLRTCILNQIRIRYVYWFINDMQLSSNNWTMHSGSVSIIKQVNHNTRL